MKTKKELKLKSKDAKAQKHFHNSKKDHKQAEKDLKIAEKAVVDLKVQKLFNRFIDICKNRIASLTLFLGATFVLFILLMLVWIKLTESKSLANYLPLEKTVFVAEFSFTPFNGGISNFKKFVSSGVYDFDKLDGIVSNFFGVEFDQDLYKWLGFAGGYALVDNDGGYSPVLFLESVDFDATIEFLEGLTLESQKDSLKEEVYNGYKFYGYAIGQNFYFINFDDYFVFASKKELIHQLIDVRSGNDISLKKNDSFAFLRTHLNKSQGFVYYDFNRIVDVFSEKVNPEYKELFNSLALMWNAGGHSIAFAENEVILQSYFDFKGKDGAQLVRGKRRSYSGDLLSKLPNNPDFVWGSVDASKTIYDFGYMLEALHPSAYDLLEGYFNALKEDHFGYEVDLREDIYPVFENEFALGLYAKADHIDYLFVADDQDQNHISKLQGYYLSTALDSGYTMVDSDNTEGFSVFPYNGLANWYTKMVDDVFVAGTDLGLVKTVAENLLSGNETLVDIGAPEKYLKNFEEINLMNTAFLYELLPENIGKWLVGFKRISGAKTVFDDGVASVHVFEF